VGQREKAEARKRGAVSAQIRKRTGAPQGERKKIPTSPEWGGRGRYCKEKEKKGADKIESQRQRLVDQAEKETVGQGLGKRRCNGGGGAHDVLQGRGEEKKKKGPFPRQKENARGAKDEGGGKKEKSPAAGQRGGGRDTRPGEKTPLGCRGGVKRKSRRQREWLGEGRGGNNLRLVSPRRSLKGGGDKQEGKKRLLTGGYEKRKRGRCSRKGGGSESTQGGEKRNRKGDAFGRAWGVLGDPPRRAKRGKIKDATGRAIRGRITYEGRKEDQIDGLITEREKEEMGSSTSLGQKGGGLSIRIGEKKKGETLFTGQEEGKVKRGEGARKRRPCHPEFEGG